MHVNAPTPILWRLLKEVLIFPKGLLGGIAFATVMWTAIVSYQSWRTTSSARRLGYAGPVAISVAGNIWLKFRGLWFCSR